MKEDFQETIKQKNDKELEAISKDYSFYSAEERLIALNELECRNGLTNELLTSKKDIEASIDAPIITEQVLEAVKSTKKIYKKNAIWVGSLLGGPLVAGYLLAENFKVFNEAGKAKKTWIFTVIGTILIFGIALLMPDDVKIQNRIIPLIYTLIAYLFAEHFQSKNISAFIALGGKAFSWWRTILVSVIGLVITVVLLLAFLFFMPQ